MFEVADQDGDGKLMYEELFAILTAMNDEVSRPSLQQSALRRSATQLAHTARKDACRAQNAAHACQASSTTLKRLVELVDEEGNGWVEWPEFREVLSLCSAARNSFVSVALRCSVREAGRSSDRYARSRQARLVRQLCSAAGVRHVLDGPARWRLEAAAV